MKKPHKHAEFIKAWADGAKIDFKFDHQDEWSDAGDAPSWNESIVYRIKPEPKPDVVKYAAFQGARKGDIFRGESMSIKHTYISTDYFRVNHFEHVIKLTFDSETGKLKSAEVLS